MTYSYDQRADVLYVTLEANDSLDCDYDESQPGVILRLSPEGKVIGITILDFLRRASTVEGITIEGKSLQLR